MRESTALGSAIAAGFATGVYKEFSELESIDLGINTFEPKTNEEERTKRMNRWEKAVDQAIGWAADEDTEDT